MALTKRKGLSPLKPFFFYQVSKPEAMDTLDSGAITHTQRLSLTVLSISKSGAWHALSIREKADLKEQILN